MVGIRSAVLAYTMWGGFTAYWKLLSDFAPADLVGWRVASATGVLVVLLVARGTWGNVVRALSDAATRRRLALASALLAINWSTYVFAVVSDRVLETALDKGRYRVQAAGCDGRALVEVVDGADDELAVQLAPGEDRPRIDCEAPRVAAGAIKLRVTNEDDLARLERRGEHRLDELLEGIHLVVAGDDDGDRQHGR